MSKMQEIYKAQIIAEQKIIAEGPPPKFADIYRRWINCKIADIRAELKELRVSSDEIERVCAYWRGEYEAGRGGAADEIAEEYDRAIYDYAQTVMEYGTAAAAEKARALIKS